MRNPLISPTWTLPALLLWSGCGLPEERWLDRSPTLSCRWQRRCDPITFYRDFDDLDDCIAFAEPPDVAGCNYDEEAARDCREALRWRCRKVGERYDELFERCDAVWTCPDGDPAYRSGPT